MEQKYRISIQLGDVKLELESTDQSWVESKEAEYLKNILERARERPILARESAVVERTPPVSGGLTINEFYQKYIKGKMVKSRPDIAVFFVYYLQKIQGKDEIKTEDVTQCFADISYPNYNKINMTDVLRRTKKRALLNYVNNLWTLTLTGEDYVLNVMASEGE